MSFNAVFLVASVVRISAHLWSANAGAGLAQ